MAGVYITAILSLWFLAFTTAQYTKTVDLNPAYRLHWRVDEAAQEIFLKIEANTTGWVGFGIGEPTSGSMPGSDILTAFVDNQGVAHVTDRYAVEFSTPIEDTACQDWVLVGGAEAQDVTTIEVKRKLQKTDNQDRDIVSGVNRIVWSMGRTDTFTKHFKQGTTSLVFFGTDPANQPSGGEMAFEISTGDTLLNPVETDYQCAIYKAPFIGDGEDYHIVEFEAVIDPKAKDYVHHFVLSYCLNDDVSWYQEDYSTLLPCFGDQPWNNTDCQKVMIWGWAPGADRLILPPIAGFRTGDSAGAIKTFHLQVHYHNPQLLSNIRDNSTIIIKYTSQTRQYDAGVIQVGDPAVTMPELPPQTEFIHRESTCLSECTTLKLPHDIQVFGDGLHMHETGSQAYTTVWRNGQYLTTLNRIDFWQFNLQQTTPQNFTLKPGDRINLHCIFNTMDRSETTMFGLGSQDEMCIDFLYYYPKVESFSYCGYYNTGEYGISMCDVDPMFLANPVADTIDLTAKTYGQTDLEECPSGAPVEMSSATSAITSTLMIVSLVALLIIQ